MRHPTTALLIPGLMAAGVLGRDVPSNIQALYKSIRAQGSCSNILKGGFYSQEGDSKDFCYCGDHLVSDGIIYLQGTGGNLVNLDIDCDGALGTGDGSCDSSTDTQGQTTFGDTVASYNKGVSDLNAYIHSFVVLGNQGSKNGFIEYDPQTDGIEPLSIVAVVCGDKLVYGVWGDTNGDDGPPLIGEVSDSLGRACYGDGVNGNQAHDENDVLYIAFRGPGAVPGADGAKWDASSFEEFEASLQAQGDKLIAAIGTGSGGGSTGGGDGSGDGSGDGNGDGSGDGGDDGGDDGDDGGDGGDGGDDGDDGDDSSDGTANSKRDDGDDGDDGGDDGDDGDDGGDDGNGDGSGDGGDDGSGDGSGDGDGDGDGSGDGTPTSTSSAPAGEPTGGNPPSGGGSLNPACAPGGNFDLGFFNLQLPVGGPDIIKSAQLQGCNGYTGDTFFTNKDSGEIVLLAPGNPDLTGCATTSGSSHCRTELREVVKGSGENAAWSPKGTNTLTVTMKVVTSDDGTHGTAIGQVFASEASKPLAEMYYSPAGDIVVGVKPDADSNQVVTKLGNVPIGTQFTYELNYSNDKLSISINGNTTPLSTFSWDSPACYFKSGNYNQGESAASSEVHIYAIDVVHS